jgi:phage tail sheath gpL-like
MSLASIILVGLGASVANPGVYVELDFAQGPVAGAGGPRSVLLMGNMLSAGSATAGTVVYGPDTAVTCQTENDVIGLFGAGSQLHRMFLRFTAVAGSNSNIPLYFIAITQSTGAQATATETIANAATSNGNHRFWCEDMFVDTPITSGQSVTTIATNIVASINGQTRWPVTATNTAGVITITANQKGTESNWIRVQAAITPATATIATTTSLTANTSLSGGTTADSNTTALSTILPNRYYYIVCNDSDATNVGALVSQVTTQALPTTGIRQRVIFGSSDTLANATTIATGINNPRAECIWGYEAVDLPPAELAATMCAIFAILEQGSSYGVARKNFSLFPSPNGNDQAYWKLIPSRFGAAGAPTVANISSALANGLSPLTIVSGVGGGAQFVKRCTTRSLNGSVSDYRIRDAHKVSVCDYWCDDAAAITALQFGGKDLLPDPAQGQPPPPSIAVTPGIWGAALKNLVIQYGNAGQWTYPPGQTPQQGQTPADVINQSFIVQAESNPPTRMSCLAPLAPVNIADQFAILAQQVA